MVDVVRTRSELINTIFADGQGAGAITPQDMRDFVLSAYGLSGWADYTDDQYTTGSAFSVSANTRTKIPNNAGTKREQELPLDYPNGLYDDVTGKILGQPGDSLLITVEFKIRRASGNGSFLLTSDFDIGGVIPPLYPRVQSLAGQSEQNVTFTTAVFTLDTWAANGADFNVESSVAVELFGIRYVIHRLHKGQGTYPPA